MREEKIGMVSLGCPKNLVDSEGMVDRLTRAGYTLTANEEEADLVLINTCGFIDSAKEESIDTILAYCRRRVRGDLKGLVVTGCLAERYADELSAEIPEVDRFLSIREEEGIVAVVDRILSGDGKVPPRTGSATSAGSFLTPFHTAYLKISEGCDNRCSYCAIPLIRGPHRSRPISELVAETESLAERGVRELILVAQDITCYGKDRNEPEGLLRLLEALSRVSGLTWIRLLYAYPDQLSDDLIERIASDSKIVPYLDLPVQHISDPVLRRMNRRGGSQRILERIRRLKSSIPDLVLRTTLIVGFPGETEVDFQRLCDFVKEVQFQHLGVFTYSREEGTPAFGFPDQVPDEVREERREILLRLQAGISRKKNRDRIGSVLPVLVEGTSPETDLLLAGRYFGQAPEIDGLVLINQGNAVTGEFYDVRITDAHDYDLVGKIL